MNNVSIYLVGASATGKTTLAKYVESEYGIHRLGSASREVFERRFSKQYKDYAELIADKNAYFEFQSEVARAQITKEECARNVHGSFVSDRSFDHLVYAAMYGTRCHLIANSDMMIDYIADIHSRKHRPLVFFCRPSFLIRQAALRDGDRGNFLDWDDMNRFDGACLFILESLGILYTSIDTADPAYRRLLVDERLRAAGIYKEEKV